MVWACMGFGGVRWTYVENTLNADEYFKEALNSDIVPFWG
jgi:hypothetical protein